METVLFGFIFGGLIQYARLNQYDTIAGMAVLRDFTVAKAIAFAIGLGSILLQLEIHLGWGAYHVKPLQLTGIVGGGLIFGTGMAVLGYCPGTLPISLGQGRVDALVGIIGGLAGSLIFSVLYPRITPWLGPDFGSISLRTAVAGNGLFWILGVLFGLVLIGVALALQAARGGGWKWLYAALGLVLLNTALNLPAVAGHPFGASTSFPFAITSLTGLGDHAYREKIAAPGLWELLFLCGAFLAGLVFALLRGNFRIEAGTPTLWTRYRGPGRSKRYAWAFVGGLLLLFGARVAGGCTSGHVISGGMQLALSSLLFSLAVFLSFLLTGRVFYTDRSRSA